MVHCWILWWHQDKGWNFRTQTSSCGVAFYGRKWLDRFSAAENTQSRVKDSPICRISRSTIYGNTWPPEHRKKAGVSSSSPWFWNHQLSLEYSSRDQATNCSQQSYSLVEQPILWPPPNFLECLLDALVHLLHHFLPSLFTCSILTPYHSFHHKFRNIAPMSQNARISYLHFAHSSIDALIVSIITTNLASDTFTTCIRNNPQLW